MAVTQQDIDALNRAIAQSERQVTLGGQTVIYRSISDLIAARNDLQRQLNAQNGNRPKRLYLYQDGRGYQK